MPDRRVLETIVGMLMWLELPPDRIALKSRISRAPWSDKEKATCKKQGRATRLAKDPGVGARHFKLGKACFIG
jgi:hypothetical protein